MNPCGEEDPPLMETETEGEEERGKKEKTLYHLTPLQNQ
jgi:hypothetical protein